LGGYLSVEDKQVSRAVKNRTALNMRPDTETGDCNDRLIARMSRTHMGERAGH